MKKLNKILLILITMLSFNIIVSADVEVLDDNSINSNDTEIKNKFNYKKEQMCMIGDQLMTDILGANRYGIYTILVDPLGKKDLKVTSINRFFEKKILKISIIIIISIFLFFISKILPLIYNKVIIT